MRTEQEPQGRSLGDQRLQAAVASGGTSSDKIYEAVEALMVRLKLRGSILDYGSGVGNFIRRILTFRNFEEISGADILERPEDLPVAVRWFQSDLNEKLAIPSGSFDVVAAVEVIEHLENPRGVARELYRVLKSGGTLLLTTPNNESIRSLVALFARGHYVAFSDSCYPAHITALLRKDISRVLKEAGFSDVEFVFTNSGGVPGHPVLSWQRISFGLLKGLRFSDNLIAICKKR